MTLKKLVNNSRRNSQSGYLLLPVAVAIALIGVIAFLISSESAIEVNMTKGELETAHAQYVAQAGLQHALRQHAQQGCGPYTDLTNVAFGTDEYDTRLTHDLGGTAPYTVNVEQDTWIRDDQPTNNYATDTKMHIRNEGGVIERPLLRYDLSAVPAKAAILSARAWFYVNKEHSEGPVDIHQITTDWTDTDATWDSMGTNIDDRVIASIPTEPGNGVWVSVNLTVQVQAWINGEPNFGITIGTSSAGVHSEYLTSESAFPPYIEVLVGTPPTSPAKLMSTSKIDGGGAATIKRDDFYLRQFPPSYVQLILSDGAGQDAMLNSFYNSRNYGGHELQVSIGSGSTIERSLLQFELPAIPPGAEIISARLELYHYVTNGTPVDPGVDVHRITRSWVEGSKDGTGTADGATWDSWDGFSNWTLSGGDYDATPVASRDISTAINDWESWDIGELVQGWIDGRFQNYGLILAGTGVVDVSFASQEDADPARHPRLSITYACACGEICATPQGDGNLLMVVVSPTTLVAEDQKAKDLFESWGYAVSVISESANQSTYDAGVAANDVVFISETVNSNQVGTKLVNAPIGVVSQDRDYNPDLGLATGGTLKVGSDIDITNTDHFITRPFSTGTLPIYTASMEQLVTTGALTADQQTLAEIDGDVSLVVLDKGAAMEGGGSAAGPRVILPLGTRYRFNWDHLNANGRLLVQRSLAWGAGDGKVSKGNVLLVVVNPGSLTTQESAKKALFESWGYNVNLIDESDSQANFDAALAANDVVYITEDVSSGSVNTKLVNAAIGVVTEEDNLSDEFGMAAGIAWESGTQVEINDNSHYITSPFSLGSLTILTANESLAYVTGTQSPDLGRLASSTSGYGVVTLEAGAAMFGGGSAAGRRAQLPWGGDNFDVNNLNADGLTILQRALEWGAGADFDFRPLAHWKLDETSGITAVDSEGAHDGTLANGPLWSAGMIGGGLRFDGAGDRISVAHDDSLSLDNFTISAWILTDSVSGFHSIVYKGASTAEANYHFYTRGDEIRLGLTNGGWQYFVETTGADLVAGRWYHVAASFDGASGDAKIYLDGSPEENGNIGVSVLMNNGPITIGSDPFNEHWDGLLDEVMIHNKLLSDSEIAELAVRPGPIAHWKFDDGSGNTAVDSVGGHDATITTPAWDAGRDGGAIRVQNDSQVAIAPHDPTLNLTRGLTLMAWVSKANLSGYDTAIDKASSGSDVNYYLGTWFDEIVFGFSTATDSWQGYYTSGVNLSTGEWDHIAATFDNAYNEVRIYRNGVQVGSFAAPFEPLTNNGNLWLGRSAISGELISGKLDDARIYDRVLDAQEIADIYDDFGAGGTGDGYIETNQTWQADDNEIWQTVDLSGFGVPANAVVEVVVENTQTGGEREGGVRAVGSTVGRRYDLQEAEGGGVDTITLHVQADASSQIQHYAENDSSIRFRLVGYWTAGSYSDRDALFTAGASNSWRNRSLSAYGVAPGQIVEIIAQNNNGSNEYQAGVRAGGSSNTQTFDLHEAEAGGRDFLSIFVEASGDASASIEVFAENDGEIEFKVVGVWDTPPGTYTEARAVLGNPTADGSWQTIDLSSFGVPSNSVVQIVMANAFASAQNQQGVRSVGSALDRRIDIHEAENGGEDLVTLHVQVDDSSQIQWRHQDVSDAHRFYLVGWWVLSP